MKVLGLPFCVLLLAACGDDKTDSNGTGSGGTTGDTTTGDSTASGSTTLVSTTLESTTGATTVEATSTGVDVGCDCLPGNCGVSICPPLSVECQELCDSGDMLDSEAALQCALESLRDRKPGKIAWFLTRGFGAFEDYVGISILEHGTAIVERSGVADLCTYSGADQHSALREPAYFEGCLAQSDPIDRFNCLSEGIGPTLSVCAPRQEKCDENESF